MISGRGEASETLDPEYEKIRNRIPKRSKHERLPPNWLLEIANPEKGSEAIEG